MAVERPIIICTRGSALALAQANLIAAQCRAAFPRLRFELKIIKTTGDKLQTASLAKKSGAPGPMVDPKNPPAPGPEGEDPHTSTGHLYKKTRHTLERFGDPERCPPGTSGSVGFAIDVPVPAIVYGLPESHATAKLNVALLLAAFIRLRRREPDLARSYRARGGTPIAAVALVLSLSVMVSCYRLEVRALQIAIAAIALLVAQFLWLKPARFREHEA